MTVTGYELSYKGDTVGLCPTHREELGIRKDDCTTVRDSMYRHGDGGSPCAVCGFDVLDALSSWALDDNKDTPRDHSVVAEEEREPIALGLCAEIISHSQNIDAWAFINLAPGHEPEEEVLATNDDGNPVATQVHHGENAVETLYVELSNPSADYTYNQMHERAVDVRNLLESFGLETDIQAHPYSEPHEDGDYWHVTAVLPDN